MYFVRLLSSSKTVAVARARMTLRRARSLTASLTGSSLRQQLLHCLHIEPTRSCMWDSVTHIDGYARPPDRDSGGLH